MKLLILFMTVLFSTQSYYMAYSLEINENDVNTFNNSESDKIDFRGPQGYRDQEFEELQRAYINPKYLDLQELKKVPVDQLSNEFIQKLINLVTQKVSHNMKGETVKYLKDILKSRQNRSFNPKTSVSDRRQVTTEFYKDIFDPNQLTSGDALDKKAKKGKKDRIDNSISVTTKRAPLLNKNAGRILNVSFSKSNDHFVSINGLSREVISTRVSYSSGVNMVDVSFYIKNISNGMIYLLKRTTSYVKGKGSQVFSYNWTKPQIPIGKYKVLIAVKFQKGNKVINREERYWGNAANNDYVVYKN